MKANGWMLSILLGTSGLPMLANAGTINFPAHKNGQYSGIIMKFSNPNQITVRSITPDKIIDSEGKQLNFEKLFKPSSKIQTRSLQSDNDPNGLQRYHKIQLPVNKQKDSEYINNLMKRLANLPQVELVYPASNPVPLSQEVSNTPLIEIQTRSATTASNTTSDFTSSQGYLDQPDINLNILLKFPGYQLGGINWFNVRNRPGAQGENVKVISAETDHWDTKHLDLPNSFKDFGDTAPVKAHDTSSVGIMGAKDNGFGVTGIVNKAKFGHLFARHYDLALLSIIEAGEALEAGDVIQIGMQVQTLEVNSCRSNCNIPMEYQPAWYDAIKTLTDKGIIVIEAAGNGNINLDLLNKFDRNTQDSGAIIVGAVCASSGKKADFSSYGKRVDSSSWGCWDVASTTTKDVSADLYDGGSNNQYTKSFAGTSSANPIVAGAAASLSSYAKGRNLTLSPIEVRTILSETGTQLKGSDGRTTDSKVIGTQPDLVRAFLAIDAKVTEKANTKAVAGYLNTWLDNQQKILNIR